MTSALFDLTGRTAVVVGGTTGIGHALALGLADAGADLAPRVDRLERSGHVVALADDEDGVHWLTPLPSNPPSTASSCPVTNVAASDAR